MKYTAKEIASKEFSYKSPEEWAMLVHLGLVEENAILNRFCARRYSRRIEKFLKTLDRLGKPVRVNF